MSDKELKVMIIKIAIGFEKGVEGIRETLNKTRNNTEEIKCPINEVRNRFHGENSRLEEAEL